MPQDSRPASSPTSATQNNTATGNSLAAGSNTLAQTSGPSSQIMRPNPFSATAVTPVLGAAQSEAANNSSEDVGSGAAALPDTSWKQQSEDDDGVWQQWARFVSSSKTDQV